MLKRVKNTSIGKFLVWPETPKREGEVDVERLSFLISQSYQDMHRKKREQKVVQENNKERENACRYEPRSDERPPRSQTAVPASLRDVREERIDSLQLGTSMLNHDTIQYAALCFFFCECAALLHYKIAIYRNRSRTRLATGVAQLVKALACSGMQLAVVTVNEVRHDLCRNLYGNGSDQETECSWNCDKDDTQADSVPLLQLDGAQNVVDFRSHAISLRSHSHIQGDERFMSPAVSNE
ncbi:hypothetical protein ANN_14691 [Periplaneta americana]|uniref:DNA recombination and repair protein Rad51-like C-terminal domain-containing protein n=1 Tax=Periplaneta americana TaxID=6978 RepID=A0ABQ8SYG4_PERAM|nr:hypothetical protein ANN_14691 [Periplaneta americana]